MAVAPPGGRERAPPSLAKFSRNWSRSGMGTFSVLRSEKDGKGTATSGRSRLDGPLRTTLDPRDLPEGKVTEMVEHDRPPLCLGQLLERGHKGGGRLRRGSRGL